MTLVVARSENGRLAMAADTLISAHGSPLPMRNWAIKLACLPGHVCVAYSGSPELSWRFIKDFRATYPSGAGYDTVISFFELAGRKTGCDFIVGFSHTGKLVSIKDGLRCTGVAKTHWIGDFVAYKRFCEYQYRKKEKPEHGRAISSVMFADEEKGSPASDIYSIMRNVVADREITSVGGFVTVISNRESEFRFSVYSDILMDWPIELTSGQDIQLTDKINLISTGENDRFSISQISLGYYNINMCAIYILKGNILCLLSEPDERSDGCVIIKNVAPNKIEETIDRVIGFPSRALSLIMSSRKETIAPFRIRSPNEGLGLNLYCEANTMK